MKGRLLLRVGTGPGAIERRASNAVLMAGGELVARLFAGRGSPITHMGLGTSAAPESEEFTTRALSNGGADGEEPLTGGTEVAVPGDSFGLETDPTKRVVLVRLRVTVPGDVAVGTIREAGLMSRSEVDAILYNRVTFAPVEKRPGEELTLFWEVSFPYGDVQWLL